MFKVEEYPSTTEFNNASTAKDWVPSLLMSFMQNIVKSELKQVAIYRSLFATWADIKKKNSDNMNSYFYI
jgi:hypothetical protein